MEIWKDAPGMGGLLRVSNKGRCLSVGRWINSIDGMPIYKEECLVGQGNGKGYISVSATVNGEKKCVALHRLVATAFIPNPEGKPQVNHIDGNKRNNAVENLEWVTSRENNIHAWKMGLNRAHRERRSLEKLQEDLENAITTLQHELGLVKRMREAGKTTKEPSKKTLVIGSFEDCAREFAKKRW